MTRHDGRPRTIPDLSAEVAQMDAELTDAEWIEAYGGHERNAA